MRVGSAFFVASWIVLSAMAPAAAGECPPSPVPFYQPLPEAPEESTGTGLEPVVRVRISVDERGRVNTVEVLAVEPTGPLDDAYRRATRATLAQWRFHPACKDGRPAPGAIEWSVKFPRRQTKPQKSSGHFADLLMPLEEKAGRRAAILSLPKEQLDTYRDEIVRKARSCLRGDVHTAQLADVVVITDAPKPEAAQSLLQVILATQRFIYDLFRDRIPAYPPKTTLYAFLYRDRSSYKKLVDLVETFDFSSGFYNPAGVLATYLESTSPDITVSMIIHETTHSFVDRFLFLPKTTRPVWLEEGFAEYMGNSDIRKGKLVPGGHEQKWMRRRVFLTVDGAYITDPTRSIARADAKDVKEAIRTGKALSLSELVGADREIFYGPKHSLFYTESWMLLHFLRHGKPGWAEKEFPDFMLYVAEGYPVREAFRTVYGRAPETMDDEFRKYVLAF